MKLKTIITSLSLLISLAIFGQTTNLVVYANDETEQTFSVDENGKLYFDDTYLYINTDGSTVESVEISSIKKIVFSGTASSSSEIIGKNSFYIYPNPAASFLRIANAENENLQLKIFTLNGQMFLNTVTSGSDQIDISALPSGFYVLKINNEAYKFTKL